MSAPPPPPADTTAPRPLKVLTPSVDYIRESRRRRRPANALSSRPRQPRKRAKVAPSANDSTGQQRARPQPRPVPIQSMPVPAPGQQVVPFRPAALTSSPEPIDVESYAATKEAARQAFITEKQEQGRKPRKLTTAECRVCLETEVENAAVGPCGHVFCYLCYFKSLQASRIKQKVMRRMEPVMGMMPPVPREKLVGKCPICRAKTKWELVVVLEVKVGVGEMVDEEDEYGAAGVVLVEDAPMAVQGGEAGDKGDVAVVVMDEAPPMQAMEAVNTTPIQGVEAVDHPIQTEVVDAPIQGMDQVPFGSALQQLEHFDFDWAFDGPLSPIYCG